MRSIVQMWNIVDSGSSSSHREWRAFRRNKPQVFFLSGTQTQKLMMMIVIIIITTARMTFSRLLQVIWVAIRSDNSVPVTLLGAVGPSTKQHGRAGRPQGRGGPRGNSCRGIRFVSSNWKPHNSYKNLLILIVFGYIIAMTCINLCYIVINIHFDMIQVFISRYLWKCVVYFSYLQNSFLYLNFYHFDFINNFM